MEHDCRKNYSLILVLTLTASINVMAFQVAFSAVLDQVQLINGISSFMASMLASSPSFFIILLSSISGKIMDKSNPVLISFYSFLFILGVSILGIFTNGFYQILILRLLSGIAFAPLLVMAFKLPQMVYPKEMQNRMLTIQTLGAPIGAIVMLFSGAWLGTTFGYTFTYIPSIFFSLIGSIVSFYVSRCFKIEKPEQFTYKKIKLQPVTNSMAVAWMFFTGSTAIFLYLGTMIGKSLGAPLYLAVFGSAFLMIPPLFVSPIVGEIMDKRISRFRLILISSMFMSLAFLLMWINGTVWIISAVVLGASASMIPPVIFSIPSKFEKPENSGYAVGKINMYGTLGILLTPPIAGFIFDINSSWVMAMVFAAVMSLTIAAFAIINRRSLAC